MRPAGKVVGGGGAGGVDRARGEVEGDDPQTALYRRLNYFPTPPWAARAGGELIQRLDPGRWWAWEPACGEGHMAHGLAPYFERVFATDVHDHGSALQHGPPLDFTADAGDGFEADWIVTNPPNEHTETFIRLGLQRARRGVAILTRLTYLDTLGRFALFHDERAPLAWLAPFAERVPMHLGRWEPDGDTMTPAAWFVWMNPEALAESRIPRLAMGGLSAFAGQMIPPGTRARLTKPEDARLFGRTDRNPTEDA